MLSAGTGEDFHHPLELGRVIPRAKAETQHAPGLFLGQASVSSALLGLGLPVEHALPGEMLMPSRSRIIISVSARIDSKPTLSSCSNRSAS